jgi:hypothetical protein
LPYAGEALKIRLDEKGDPAAVIVVDAFRFELSMRLAQRINEEQAATIATVSACMAPVPTTTELGMAYALPGVATALQVAFDAEKGWQVQAEGFELNLAIAESRRKWLTAIYNVKPSQILSIPTITRRPF